MLAFNICQALCFHVSLSCRPAFHRSSWVSSPASVLKRCLWKAVDCATEVTHEDDRFPAEGKVHPCKSRLCSAKAPRGSPSTESSKTSLPPVPNAKRLCLTSDFHRRPKCLRQGDFKTFQDVVLPHSLCLQLWPENLPQRPSPALLNFAGGAQQFHTLPSNRSVE